MLFREDIDVSSNGTTLRLESFKFARNANIEDMEEGMRTAALKLRFRRLEYRWSRDLGPTTWYALHPPRDDEVGSWDSDTFVPMSR